MQKLKGVTWATALDLNMGYYHIQQDPDEQMYKIMSGFDFIKTYLNDLLMMMSDTLDNYLHKLTLLLDQLQANGLKVNTDKSTFCATEIKCLGYWITQDRIQPLPKKYYQDIWQQRSHILAPLTDLLGKGKKKFKWER
eukprot:10721365-Ditylum_brightwellii.AAC.1